LETLESTPLHQVRRSEETLFVPTIDYRSIEYFATSRRTFPTNKKHIREWELERKEAFGMASFAIM